MDEPGRARFERVLPEPRALRILFYQFRALVAFLLFWVIMTTAFLLLMTYRTFHPLSALEIGMAVVFGALMPLTLLLGSERREIAKSCALPPNRNASVVPSLLSGWSLRSAACVAYR